MKSFRFRFLALTLALCAVLAAVYVPVFAVNPDEKPADDEYVYRLVDAPRSGGVYCMVSLQQGAYYAVSNIDREDAEGLEPIRVRVAGDYVVGNIGSSLLWQFTGGTDGYRVSSVDDGEYLAKLNYALTTSASAQQSWEYIIHTNDDSSIGDEPVMHNITAGGYILYRTSGSGAYFDCFNAYQQCNILLFERRSAQDFVPVTGIELECAELSIPLGETHRFEPTIIPADATIQAVTYASSNPSVAEINSDGLLITGDDGVTSITVYDGTGEISASCVVTVTDECGVQPDIYGYRLYGGSRGIVKFGADSPGDIMLIDDQSDEPVLTAMCCADGILYGFENGAEGYDFISMEFGRYVRRASNICAGYFVRDMTFDPETGLIYCIMATNPTMYSLYYAIYTVNPRTGAFNLAGQIDAYLTAIACTDDGRMYGVDHGGRLYLIDKATAECALVGSTGVSYANHEQSMCFSPVNGRMYWMQADDDGGGFYEINLATAAARHIGCPGGDMLSYEQIVGLFVPEGSAQYERGDVNMDGTVDAVDALLAMRQALGIITLTAEQAALADMNSDNAVTSTDALLILRAAL